MPCKYHYMAHGAYKLKPEQWTKDPKTTRLAMTAAVRKDLYENPGHFDPRQYLKPARDEMKKMYIHKIVEVLGSDGKA